MSRQAFARRILALALLGVCGFGCQPEAERNAPSESEKAMLQCKDNLRELTVAIKFDQRRKGKGLPPTAGGVPTCPAAGSDTYSESYDPKAGKLFCQGHHHAQVGLEPDFPRVDLKQVEDRDRLNRYRDRADFVKENSEGKLSLPTGFPLPLEIPVEVQSTTVGRRDGVWHVSFRYEGDLKALEERWREVLNAKVYNPNAKERVGFGGNSPLANQVSVGLNLETRLVDVGYEPKFIIDDRASE